MSKTSLSPSLPLVKSSQQATTLVRSPGCCQRRGFRGLLLFLSGPGTFRGTLSVPLPARKLHTRGTRRANTSAFDFTPNHGEKLRKSHFFPTTSRQALCSTQRREDFDRLTSLSAKLSDVCDDGYVKCAPHFCKGPNVRSVNCQNKPNARLLERPGKSGQSVIIAGHHSAIGHFLL